MSRRTSPVLVLLVLVLLFLLAWLFWRSQSPPTDQSPHTSRSYSERRPSHRGERSRERRPERSEGSERSRLKAPGGACDSLGITCASRYFGAWQQPEDGTCSVGNRAGNPMPDPRCTPGGVDPTVTAEVLQSATWRTRCIRNCETSEAQKHITYGWYGVPRPRGNSGENQICELDHLVPLELGGADGFANIWPECGPDDVELRERNFKIKDRVENYLASEVRAGRMPLDQAQHGIASDWTQYLPAANRYCSTGGNC